MKLTQEQLAELIAKIYTNLIEKRKAEGGSDDTGTGEFSAEEINAEISNVLSEEGMLDDTSSDDTVSDSSDISTEEKSGNGETPAISKDVITQILSALNNNSENSAEKKSAGNSRENMHHKYADIFLPKSSNSGYPGNTSGFKSRISSMSAPERRKTAYGMFGRAVKCIHSAGGDAERAAFTAEHKFNDTEMAHEFKALSVTTASDGGYIVPEVYASEIIELLYPATVIYSLGARRLGMANGNLNLPKIRTGARATFTGENRAIPKTSSKFGNLRLSAKKLTALIPMSNDLLRSTNFDNDVIVGQDITKQMALGVDWGALMGSGGEFQPLGITRNKNVMNIDVTTLGGEYASTAGAPTSAFPNYLVACVLKNNVYADGLGFVFNTSVEQYFKSIRDATGGFVFAKEMNERGTLVGYPYRATNLLETKDGKTQIIFGNWNDLIIGEQGALEIETSREGAWTDESGSIVSAFENDQTLIRAINNVDAGLRHDESFAVANKISAMV